MGVPPIPPSAPTLLVGTPLAAAQRLCRAAARGISPINGVLGTSPTFSQAATNAASTLNAAVAVATTTTNFAAGSFAANDTAYIEQIGGPLAYNGSSGYIGDTVINVLATPTRQGGHGMGARFGMRELAFEVGMQNSGSPHIVYVTDPQTRIRQRVQAADQAVTSGLSYCKWTFATAVLRIIEVYPVSFTRLTNIVVGSGKSIFRAPLADDPVVGILGDSWPAGSSLGGATNTIKMGLADYLGERLGCTNPIVPSVASTGLLGGANVATSGTYRQRITAGDINSSRIGNFDVLFIGGSLNDQSFTDGQRGAEFTLTLQAALAAQPNAIIFAYGPQYTTSTTTTQATFDAHRDGAIAAGFSVWSAGQFTTIGTSPRLIYLDNSLAGGAWLYSGNVATFIGGDNNHLNDAGVQYYPYRMADTAIAAVRARFNL